MYIINSNETESPRNCCGMYIHSLPYYETKLVIKIYITLYMHVRCKNAYNVL